MKKEQAIEILRRQQTKIPAITIADSETWITQTASYIKEFFGPDSPEMKAINEFRYYDTNDLFLGRASGTLQTRKPVAETFINNCIETIIDKGLYKPPKLNFLYTWRGDVVTAFAIAISGGLFYLGTVVGQQGANTSILELKQQVRDYKDTLTGVRAAFHIADSIAKSHTNSNENSIDSHAVKIK